jgi:hypothetical protein
MAQQSAVKRAGEVVPDAPKRGRAVGSRNKPKVKVYDYDRYKLSFQKSADFYGYIEGYPDKTGLLISVYRLRPRIDHSLIGNNQSAILQTANVADVTEEQVGDTFGRGAYMLKLNDGNRPRGQQECCRTWLEITDHEKPPQYDPRTLCLGEAKNQDEITRLLNSGVLVRDAHGAPRLRGENDPAAPPVPVGVAGSQPQNGELFSRDVIGQIVLAALNRGSQSPHDAVKDTIEVARLIQPPALDVETIVERVIARVGVVPGKNGALDPFSNYERMEQFIARVRGPVQAAAGVVEGVAAASEPGASWAPHLAGILAQARALLPEVKTMFSELREQNGAGLPPQNRVQKPMTMEQRIEQIATMGYEQMQQGVSGFDFAAYVCNFHPGGLEVYRQLEPAGAVGVIALAAMNPATRPLVNAPDTRAQLESFLSDFFTFDPSGGSDASASDGVAAA